MPQTNLDDKRCSQRVLIRRPVKYQSFQLADRKLSVDLLCAQSWQPAQLIDLSDCGAGILCDQPPKTALPVALSFSLPNYDNDAKLILQAQITRVAKVNRQYLIGLKLLNPSAHERLVIREFFRYHQRFSA